MDDGTKTSGVLVLVRHGESQWNAKNVWTGLTDIPLTQKGRDEAKAAAGLLTGIVFDAAFTSNLVRAQETLAIILEQLHESGISITRDGALNERNYGIYTGKNKLEIRSQLGEEEFLKLRRGWDYPVPQGESLKEVYARVIPYYDQAIAPLVTQGKHVLVVAHGNSLRALIKKMDDVSDADIPMVELKTGEVVVYHINGDGAVISHEKRLVEI